MAKYITPVVAALQAILAQYMPGALDGSGYVPFVDIGEVFTGVMDNAPEAWVMGVRSQMDDEGNVWNEKHTVTVKFGVTATDPDDLGQAARVYMKAITDAVNSAAPADWTAAGGSVPNRVLVYEHDYGPVFEKGGVLARFPEAHIDVEVYEQ